MIALLLCWLSITASAQAAPIDLSFAGGGLHAEVSWLEGPRSPEESRLRVEWVNAQGAPTEPGRFKVSLWMPEMSHGSAPTQVARVLGSNGAPLPGVFDVTNLYFTMGGRWEVRMTVLLPNGKEETRGFPVVIGSMRPLTTQISRSR